MRVYSCVCGSIHNGRFTIDEEKIAKREKNKLKIFNSIRSFIKIFISKPTGLLTAFLFFILSAHAQSASGSLDRNKILLGEQVTLQLKAEDINTRMFFLQDWFNLPDSISHMQIVKRNVIDTIDVGGVTTYTQTLTI